MKLNLGNTAVIIVLLSLAYAGGNDTSQPRRPKSPTAVAAIQKHDAADVKAREAYVKAIIAADEREIADLQSAFVAATKAANLDEAEAIRARRQAAADDEKRQQEGLANSTASKWISWLTGDTKRWIFPDGTAMFGSAESTGTWTRDGDVMKFVWKDGSHETFWLDNDGKPFRGRWDDEGRELTPVKFLVHCHASILG